MKNIIFGFLFFCSLSIQTQAVFLDVDTTHPFYHGISELEQRGIVKGHALGDRKVFKPREVINRVEALKIILLSAETEIPSDLKATFPDVSDSHWFFPYVEAAVEYEIVKGFPNGTFRPGSKVTRAEFLKILLESFGLAVEAPTEDESWYDPYFGFAKEYRLLPDEESAHGLITRGEGAEIIYRTLQVASGDFAKKYTFLGSGKASYYNEGFAGRPTATGETYDPFDMTAAHRTLPFGTRLKVYNENQDFVVVRINDRGPYHKSRILDLSEAAFKKLAPVSTGVITVHFEVFSDPNDKPLPIPEQVRPQLSTEVRTTEIPEIIQSVLQPKTLETKNIIAKKTGIPTQPLFKESVGVVGKTFFPGIMLRETFPQKLPEGFVFHLKGSLTTEDRYKKVKVFIQNQSSGAQSQFEANVSGKNFAVPLHFFESGIFDLGIVFDDQRESKVVEIEVARLNRERRYSASESNFTSPLEVGLIPETKEVAFRWASVKNRLTKIVVTQGNIKRTAFFVKGLNYFKFPHSFFADFEVDKDLAIDLFQADSEDGSLDKQFTNWKKSTFKNYKLIRGFPDFETKNISIRPFNRYVKTLAPIVIKGKVFNGVVLNETAFITLPSGKVQVIDVIRSGEDFQFVFTPTMFGQYIVEVIAQDGEILFNRAIYANSNLILPIYPRKQTIIKVNNKTAIVDWINRIRVAQELPTLVSDIHIQKASQAYADKMVKEDFIAHVSPAGETTADRVKHLNLTGFGENLSVGSDLNLALIGLENSGSHRANIISPRWSKVGIGLAQNQNGDFYVVQIFAK